MLCCVRRATTYAGLMRAVLRLGLKGILLRLALLQLINRFREKQPYIGEACLYTKPPPRLSEFCRANELFSASLGA